MTSTFRPRVFWLGWQDARIGIVIAWEWETPALLVYLLCAGVRIGWDWTPSPEEEAEHGNGVV